MQPDANGSSHRPFVRVLHALLAMAICTLSPHSPTLASHGICRPEAPLTKLFEFPIDPNAQHFAIDPQSRNIYVAVDRGPGTGEICYYDLYGTLQGCWNVYDPGQPAAGPSQPSFESPNEVGVRDQSNTLIVSGGGGFREYSLPSGGYLRWLPDDQGDPLTGAAFGMTFDPAGDMYVGFGDLSVGQLVRYDFATGGLFVAPTDPLPTDPCFTGLGVTDVAWLSTSRVAYVEFRPLGWPPEFGENRIRVLHPGTGTCDFDIGSVSGQTPGFFRAPQSAVEGSDSRIYVADINRLHVVDATDGTFLSETEDPSATYIGVDQVSNGGEDFVYLKDEIVFGVSQTLSVYSAPMQIINVLNTDFLDSTNNYIFDTQDMSKYATCLPDSAAGKLEMLRIAADGVARVLLRMELPEATSFDLKVQDPQLPGTSEDIGRIQSLDGSVAGTDVTLSTQEIDGKHYLLAAYWAPGDFDRAGAGDETRGEWQVEFLLSVGSISQKKVGELTVVRPPVVRVHGVFESPRSWRSFKGLRNPVNTPIWKVLSVDYSSSHGARLPTNLLHLEEQVTEFWQDARDDDRMALAQFDFVTHSMGGVLLHMFSQDSNSSYRNGMNAGTGFVNRALLLNTPHEGSPATIAADRIFRTAIQGDLNGASRAEILEANILKELAALVLGNPQDSQMIAGALIDMFPNSPVLSGIGTSTNLPNRSYVGSAGQAIVAGLATNVQGTAAAMLLLVVATNAPEMAYVVSEPSDIAVPLASQKHGLPESSIHDDGGFAGFHTGGQRVSNTAGQMADDMTRIGPLDMAGYYAANIPSGGGPPKMVPAPSKSTVPRTLVWDALAVQVDLDGPSAEYGEDIVARVLVDPAYPVGALDQVLILSEAGTRVLTPGPGVDLEMTLPTADALANPATFTAVATTTNNELLVSRAVEVPIATPNVTLSEVVHDPTSFRLAVGETRDLAPLQVLADSTTVYPIPEADITYSLDTPGIARVTEGGVLQALSPGETALRIRVGLLQAVVDVTVEDGPAVNNAPRVVLTAKDAACAGTPVCVSAAESFDFDEVLGDVVSFAWDSDLDGAFDDGAGESLCFQYTPGVNDIVRVRATDLAGATGVGSIAILEQQEDCNLDVICVLDESSPGTTYVEGATDVEADAFGRFAVADATGATVVYVTDECEDVARIGMQFEDLTTIAMTNDGVTYAAFDSPILLITGCVTLDGYLMGCNGPNYQQPLVTGFSLPLRWSPSDESTFAPFFNMDIGGDQLVLKQNDAALSWNSAQSSFGEIDVSAELVFGHGHLYVVDPTRVLKLAYSPGSLTEVIQWGSAGSADGQFLDAVDIDIRSNGSVLVLDQAEREIQEFLPDGTHVQTLDLEAVTGFPFVAPSALAVSSNDVIAVVDQGQVVVFDPWMIVTAVDPEPRVNAGLSLRIRSDATGGGSRAFHIQGLRPGLAFRVAVYDVRGRLIRNLRQGVAMGSSVSLRWAQTDSRGVPVGSGVYFVRVEQGGEDATAKALVLE